MNNQTVLEQITKLPEEAKNELVLFVEFLTHKYQASISKEDGIEKRVFGISKDIYKMSEDFDETLEEFKDYMPE
jgi:hypothetical protein